MMRKAAHISGGSSLHRSGRNRAPQSSQYPCSLGSELLTLSLEQGEAFAVAFDRSCRTCFVLSLRSSDRISPSDVGFITHRRLTISVLISPRRFASSQNGSSGWDLRQAGITCPQVRSRSIVQSTRLSMSVSINVSISLFPFISTLSGEREAACRSASGDSRATPLGNRLLH